MKIKAVIIAFLLFSIIVSTIGVASAGIPPQSTREQPPRPPQAPLPPAPPQQGPPADLPGLEIADSHAPDEVPP